MQAENEIGEHDVGERLERGAQLVAARDESNDAERTARVSCNSARFAGIETLQRDGHAGQDTLLLIGREAEHRRGRRLSRSWRRKTEEQREKKAGGKLLHLCRGGRECSAAGRYFTTVETNRKRAKIALSGITIIVPPGGRRPDVPSTALPRPAMLGPNRRDAALVNVMPGIRLGPYEIIGLLGAGGMGEVYRARDTRLDRIVAIKVLPGRLASSPHSLERFQREARAVAALNHPNICTIHDIDSGEAGGRAYLAMELVDGETLHRRLQRGALPVHEIVDIAIALADALDAAAHAKGIVHRDIKPANIM